MNARASRRCANADTPRRTTAHRGLVVRPPPQPSPASGGGGPRVGGGPLRRLIAGEAISARALKNALLGSSPSPTTSPTTTTSTITTTSDGSRAKGTVRTFATFRECPVGARPEVAVANHDHDQVNDHDHVCDREHALPSFLCGPPRPSAVKIPPSPLREPARRVRPARARGGTSVSSVPPRRRVKFPRSSELRVRPARSSKHERGVEHPSPPCPRASFRRGSKRAFLSKRFRCIPRRSPANTPDFADSCA
jgi:hypothetical protein